VATVAGIHDVLNAISNDNPVTATLSDGTTATVGSIGNKYIAVVSWDGTNVTSQGSIESGLGKQPYWVFQPTPGDTTGTQINVATMNKTLQATAFSTGTVVAYDANYALIQVVPPGGGSIVYYLVSDAPFSNIPPAGQYPITDLTTSGTSFTPPPVGAVCFVEGTRIRTSRGDVAVECLAEGDEVQVVDPKAADDAPVTLPVIWIGHRRIDLTTHRDPFMVQPIRIRRDAFAAGAPGRDLLVSPEHAIFVAGVLVPARLLINGATIVREQSMREVRYFHVELERHAVLLSENLPTESYLDTGNRVFFQNGGKVMRLHADEAVFDNATSREGDSCASFADAPGVVRPIWQLLADRAEAMGYTVVRPVVTSDPGVRLDVEGRSFRPISSSRGVYSFILPAGRHDVRIVSRAARPADVRPWIEDHRVLGVSVSAIRIRHDGDVTDLPLDGPVVRDGWWKVEHDGPRMSRWTDGAASLRLPEIDGVGRVLELTLGGAMTYPLEVGPLEVGPRFAGQFATGEARTEPGVAHFTASAASAA
jgi:Hint domain